jgi:opacity protein-like surface antigen
MKKLNSHLLGLGASLALLSASATAGEPAPYSQPIAEMESISLFSVQPYALYGHTFGSENNADGWGAGISLLTPGVGVVDNFEFGYDWREGSSRDLHTLQAYGRHNLIQDSAFTPYVVGGPSYSWGFPESGGSKNTWNLDFGFGMTYDLTSSLSLMADYRYRWDLENKLDDSGFARLGLSIHF